MRRAVPQHVQALGIVIGSRKNGELAIPGKRPVQIDHLVVIIECHSTGNRGFGKPGPDGCGNLGRGRPVRDVKSVAVRQSNFQKVTPYGLGTPQRRPK